MASFNQMTKSDHVFVFPRDEAEVDVASNGEILRKSATVAAERHTVRKYWRQEAVRNPGGV